MKQKNKWSMILNGLGALIFIAMGLDLTPHHNNLAIFLGVACFVISGVISKMYNDECKNKENCS